MSLDGLFPAVAIAGLLLLVVYLRLGPRIVGLVRRRLQLFARIVATVLGAQLVGLVFFADALLEAQTPNNHHGHLINAAGSLTTGALISIIGLMAMLLFAAIDRQRQSRIQWRRNYQRIEKAAFACAVVGIAFAVLIHVALIVPRILLNPLI